MNSRIIQGNNVDVLRTFPDCHFDSIVTDPPYGIDFLGKSWDANTGALETYQECLRVLKPGGHIVAFSAARTYHHLAVTIEQAGFEIRDQIMWIYSSGFPKSQDVGRSIQRSIGATEYEEMVDTTKNSGFGMTDHARVRAGEEWSTTKKQVGKVKVTDPEAKVWAGWGTQLKPAHEPIVLARKPIQLSIAGNCQAWGVGALNIDATRIAYADDEDPADFDPANNLRDTQGDALYKGGWGGKKKPSAGRRTATFGSGPSHGGTATPGGESDQAWEASQIGRFPSNVVGEIAEPYQKYFYCPKVSRKERHIGFDEQYSTGDAMRDLGGKWTPMETASGIKSVMTREDGSIMPVNEVQVLVEQKNTGNNHPTVKPIELMKYLIKLITPAGGKILDPFNGSGSTGCAAVELDYDYTGIELDRKYVAIAERRIEAWYQHTHPLQASGLFA